MARNTPAVVLEAVRRTGWSYLCNALEYASEALQADREIVLEAVRQDGYALEYASGDLQADRDFVLEAVRQTWRGAGIRLRSVAG